MMRPTRTRPVRTALLGALAGAVLLAGCSGSDQPPSPPSGGPTSPAAPPAVTSSGSGAAPTGSAGASTSRPATPTVPSRTRSSGSPGTTTAAPRPIATRVVQGAQGESYKVAIWAFVTNKTCADHAHGRKVVAFLKQHPCRSLRRLLATTTLNGRPVGIAAEAVDLPGGTADRPFGTSADYQNLISTPTNGGPDDLLRDGRRFPGAPSAIPAHAVFSYGGQDASVYTLHAWYLSGDTAKDPAPLTQMLSDVSVLLAHRSF